MTATEVILNQTVAINNSLNDIGHILRQAQQVVAPINLDLGGALAAAGLMFTVYQLGKPEWNVVFKIRNFLGKIYQAGLLLVGYLIYCLYTKTHLQL